MEEIMLIEEKIKSLGRHYRPRDGVGHDEWLLIADIPAENSDGISCKVYETRMPARFFKLVVGEALDFMGRPKGGVVISSGSGNEMGELIGQIAIATSQGMLSFE
jgi:hypothetical protein